MTTFHLRLLLLAVLLAACSFMSDDDDDDTAPVTDDDDDDITTTDDDDTDDGCTTWKDCDAPLTCRNRECVTPALPVTNAWATDLATYDINTDNLLIGGKRITPVGERLWMGTQPTRVLLARNGKYAVVNEATWGSESTSNRGIYYLQVVDTASWEVVSKVTPESKAVWHGLAVVESGDTTHVWSTDGPPGNLNAFNLDVDGQLSQFREIPIEGCYSSGLAVSADESLAYVTCMNSGTGALNGKLAKINLDTDAVTMVEDLPGAFSPVLSPDGARLFVASISTAARPEEGDVVWVFDTATGSQIREIRVGWAPQGMVFHPVRNELYVACNASDEIFVLDAASLDVERVIPLHNDPAPLKGYYPVWFDFTADGSRLYIAASHENAILVMDDASGDILGKIPTAWYPNDLEVVPGGNELIVSEGRGVGEGPADYLGDDKLAGPGRTLRGSVARIPVPDAAALAEQTQLVDFNNNRQATYFDFSGGNDTPLPNPDAPLAASSKIKHIFFILKENMAYDAGYGDLEVGNGEPEYALWGEEGLPNQRKIAREHVLFDNFYCLSDSSIDGHQWPSLGIETDFIEKHNWHSINHGFGTIAISLTPGTQGDSLPFMPHLIEHGHSVMGFGGIENFGTKAFTTYADYLAPGYDHLGGFHATDWSRAEEFKELFESQLEAGTVPAFTWIFIGNNHGEGLRVGKPTPDYWVRENDLAVGIIVDAISKSPVWEESMIFITEDDSQNGYDHVDTHRCATIALGPWLKRNYVSSVVYSINNFHKTVELLLGVPPMHRLDAMAIGMYDIFAGRPDDQPFEANLDPVHEEDYIYNGPASRLTAWSEKMNWSDIDLNPDAAAFYWAYKKGTAPPKPSAYYRHRMETDED